MLLSNYGFNYSSINAIRWTVEAKPTVPEISINAPRDDDDDDDDDDEEEEEKEEPYGQNGEDIFQGTVILEC